MDDLFEQSSSELWEQRRNWIDKELEEAEIGFSYLVSDHATALFMDMQIAFCAGAWLSVIVMAVSVIDAHLRETASNDNNIGTAKLLNEYYEGENINWLRKLRNTYVHLNMEKPTLEMNAWFNNQKELEADAVIAMQMTIKALFQNPGT